MLHCAKWILYSLLFFSQIMTLRAQVFSGTVKDRETNLPISNANIFFIELHTGTASDGDGHFSFDQLPQKKIQLQVSCIGYKTSLETIDLSVIKEMTFYLERSHIDLEEVVVSIPTGKLQLENMAPVERIRMDEFPATEHLTLLEIIANIPGIEQNTTGVGIGKPVIRGLTGNRVVTYAQGIRVENQQWGDEHGLGIAETGIESIEVIKGPASLLYGSDALGGVLYLVDARYALRNQLEGTFGTRFHTNTMGSMTDLGLKWHQDQWKVNLFGAFASHADYQIPSRDRVFNTRFDEKSLKASIGFNKNHWISNLRYSFLQNQFGIHNELMEISSTERKPALPFQKVTHHLVSFENTFLLEDSRLNVILGYNDNLRNEFEDDRNTPALALDLQTSTFEVKWHSPIYNNQWNLITGIQGMYQTNLNSGSEFLIPDATTFDIGGFTLTQFNLPKLQLQVGLRFDYRAVDTEVMFGKDRTVPPLSTNFSNFNYSAGFVYPMKPITLRANISSGFRAPNSSELLSYGVHEGTNRFEIGNEGLDSEHATQFDISIDYQNEHLHITVNPFYNVINNFIYLSPTDSTIEQTTVFEYIQNKAFLFGGEMSVHWHPHKFHWLHIGSSLATVLAEDQNQNPIPLIPATQLDTKVRADLSSGQNVFMKDFYIQHIFKFKQNRTGIFESPSDAYHLINLGLTLAMNNRKSPLEFTAGVNNLLNAKYTDHLSRFKTEGIPNPGINFHFGIRYRFEKAMDP